MELKNYQIQSLESVADFLQQCRTRPVAEVYAERSKRLAQQQLKYFDYLNLNVPDRLPLIDTPISCELATL